MKSSLKSISFLWVFIFSFNSFSQEIQVATHRRENPVHIPPDMDGTEIQSYLKLQNIDLLAEDKGMDADIRSALMYGERNLTWLKLINSVRPEGSKLSMTNSGNRIGIPIFSPNKYNPQMVSDLLNKLKSEMPAKMSTILFTRARLTPEAPLADKDYLTWARQMDRVYQTAARWQLMKPHRKYYKMRSNDDVRGYYHLAQIKGLDEKLMGWSMLAQEEQEQLKSWLLQVCMNATKSAKWCLKSFKYQLSKNQLLEFKNAHWAKAEALYKDFFTIQARQDDVKYVSENEYKLTFLDPGSAELRDFLKINLEDEWKWKDWSLKIDFAPSASVRMKFEAGTTPHVNSIAGDIITMDQNTPLTEWEVQWIIRHEFGHVLGFPDCYIEFYSESEKSMVNYQLDISNLMCSRAGNMKQVIYDEMKRVYSRP